MRVTYDYSYGQRRKIKLGNVISDCFLWFEARA
jgi:hypothetical protein